MRSKPPLDDSKATDAARDAPKVDRFLELQCGSFKRSPKTMKSATRREILVENCEPIGVSSLYFPDLPKPQPLGSISKWHYIEAHIYENTTGENWSDEQSPERVGFVERKSGSCKIELLLPSPAFEHIWEAAVAVDGINRGFHMAATPDWTFGSYTVMADIVRVEFYELGSSSDGSLSLEVNQLKEVSNRLAGLSRLLLLMVGMAFLLLARQLFLR
jgi:hypothetical protein